jgi:predicted TIM-barrel fold metal-dependent hydrolase
MEATIHPLRFLDATCIVGPMHSPPPGYDPSPAALLRKMDELGIAEACPATVIGREFDPRAGNDWLKEHVPSADRLHPVWTAATHHTGEFPRPEALLHQLREHGVRMLRFFLSPTAFLNRLDLPVLGELLDALDAHRVPLLLDAYGAGQLQATELEPVLRGWPHLPLILSVSKVTQDDRWLYYLWERHEHLYVDLPGYQQLCGIERVVERFGPRRLVYGSRYPQFTPLQTMLQVIYAEVDEGAKRAIAGGTLRGLLAEARP